MIDSWMPRKLDPGLAATYSRLSDFNTSTMKSPPGRSVVTMSASSDGSLSRGAIGAVAGAATAGVCGAVCAAAPAAPPTRAAPVTAALFRKSRRSTDPFFDISLSSADLKVRRYVAAVAYNSQRFMAIRRYVPAALQQGQANEKSGIEYDENLSTCGPPGYPRWLVIPFLREFIVRPEETWLTSETVNNVRRIYTDGRDHPPVDERYPLYYGDSIGFWDGQKLVIHTNQLMERSMGRNQPTQSDKMETVEVWQKISPTVIKADVWIYDPALYTEPWYMERLYTRVANEDKSLRIRYWNCNENPNNDVDRKSTRLNSSHLGISYAVFC